ncbi:hypothetical protein PybrP1_005101 [[Pythium] brassicae (nom. inval.)]|nr:hypothetical protein PybrP1_005101 [[Pythium] brassicae (nom. inval.)]
MRAFRSTRVRRSLLLAAAAAPFAYEVREKRYANQASAEPVRFPIAKEQRVERRWMLADSASGGDRSPRHINTVKVSLPGLTRPIGAVRVSADNEALLECVEVVALQPNGLEIRFRKDAPAAAGHLLAELTLAHEAQVNAVDASGGGVVVVEDHVLVADCAHAAVSLSLRGHGELFVATPAAAVTVQSLALSVAGSGRLQFEAAELVATDDVLLQVAGAGRASVFARAKLHAPTVKASIVGSGHAATATQDLAARKLKSSISGYGEVTHIGPGRAAIQRVSIAGSGSVTSNEIVSETATVRIVGSGDATLDVKDVLEASCRGWGVVRYVNAPPRAVSSRTSLSLERARASLRRPTPADSLRAAVSSPVPARTDAFDDVAVRFDPKAAAKEQRGSALDVFGAIGAVKKALSGRSERRYERREQQEAQEREDGSERKSRHRRERAHSDGDCENEGASV